MLEALYFISGIGIFAAACYAAKQVQIASNQIKLTKEIASANARRESVKLASENCRYFAEQVIPAMNAAMKKYKEQNCAFLNPVPQAAGSPPPFIITNGDFSQVNYDIKRITPQDWEKVSVELVGFLNKLESFAIPFAAGVADDDTGFMETAPSFIIGLNAVMPAIYYLRTTQGSRWSSVLKLFNIWNNRIAAQALEPAMKDMQKMIEEGKNKIKPI